MLLAELTVSFSECAASQRSIADINSFNPQDDPEEGDGANSCFTLGKIQAQRGQDPYLRPLSHPGAGTGVEPTFAGFLPRWSCLQLHLPLGHMASLSLRNREGLHSEDADRGDPAGSLPVVAF